MTHLEEDIDQGQEAKTEGYPDNQPDLNPLFIQY
jgi:hypothetical protein